jgi:hypothetical protein
VTKEPTGPIVLYSGGTGRSGCTVLASVLGQVPGYVNVGEARYVWQKGLIDNRLCGCGERFRDCSFWGTVGERAFGGWDAIDPVAVERLRCSVDHPGRFPTLMMPKSLRRRRFEADADRFADILKPLYAAIVEVSGASVVVDSSRFATYALLLKRAGADVRMVHVVRDSRGVAFSWQKKVEVTDSPDRTIYMPTYSVSSGALRWAAYNLQTWLTRLAGLPYLFARYEDAVADPAPYLERMMAHAGDNRDRSALPLEDGRLILSSAMHTVMGNAVRLERGSIKLQVDDQWQREMAPRARRTVTAITLPLLVSYGYPLRGRKSAPVAPHVSADDTGAHANGKGNGHTEVTTLAPYDAQAAVHSNGNGNGNGNGHVNGNPKVNGNGAAHSNGNGNGAALGNGNGKVESEEPVVRESAGHRPAPESGG